VEGKGGGTLGDSAKNDIVSALAQMGERGAGGV